MHMKMPKHLINNPSFNDYLAEYLKDDDYREGFMREKMKLEVSMLVMNLRKKKKVSQKELATRLGTSQSAVARLEAGKGNVTIDTLGKIAHRLGGRLKISIG